MQLIFEIKDASFKHFLMKGKSRNVDYNNIQTLVILICKSIWYISAPIIRDTTFSAYCGIQE